MSTALVTFTNSNNDAPENLIIVTLTGTDNEVDQSCSWSILEGAVEQMDRSMKEMLASEGPYPYQKAHELLECMQWRRGLSLIRESGFTKIKFKLNCHTNILFPELLPYISPSGKDTWLDTIAPCFRTLDHVADRRINRHSECTLAILVQSDADDIFYNMGISLQRQLPSEIITDIFQGQEVVGSEGRFSYLSKVFHDYKAVLFIGHLHFGSGSKYGGWCLTDRNSDILTMEELRTFFPASGSRSTYHVNGKVVRDVRTPDIVFVNSCFSAGYKDIKAKRDQSLSFPKLFLDGGVKYFVGTSLRVTYPSENPKKGRDTNCALIREFFTRWTYNPDGAVEHLYEAKKALEFPLVSSLFQIYAAKMGCQVLGAMVGRITVDCHLGSYQIEKHLWSDECSLFFWASHLEVHSKHIIQVFTDEWQDRAELINSIDATLESFHEKGLTGAHLVPDVHECVLLYRPGKPEPEMGDYHIVVYNRPADDESSNWQVIDPPEDGKNTLEQLERSIRLANFMASLIAELHRKDVLHGNLGMRSFVLSMYNNTEQIYLLNSWIRQASNARFTHSRYSAPGENGFSKGADEFSYDCYSLGVVLHELFYGTPPVERDGEAGNINYDKLHEYQKDSGIPEGISRVICDCLVPKASLRPRAAKISERLLLAIDRGEHIDEFAAELNFHILAGYRVFAVKTDDVNELSSVLKQLTLCSRPHTGAGEATCYTLFEIAYNKGLTNVVNGTLLIPWLTAHDVASLYAGQGQRTDPERIPAREIGNVNGIFLINQAIDISKKNPDRSIILINGGTWWDYGSVVWRIFRRCQEMPAQEPVFIIADSFLGIAPEARRFMMCIDFPFPGRSVLFDTILRIHTLLNLDIPPVDNQVAAILAGSLFPCTMRELRDVMRLSALKYGKIDNKALVVRDEMRESIFDFTDGVKYIPSTRLPKPGTFTIASPLRREIEFWCNTVKACEFEEDIPAFPHRIAIFGERGSGKTSLALVMASNIEVPVVVLDIFACLRSLQGDSEQALQSTLWQINSMHKCVVLLDNIDAFLDNLYSGGNAGPDELHNGNGANSLRPTLMRMESILLRWLDELPQFVLVFMTALHEERLPSQWRRRADMVLYIPAMDREQLPYRQEVINSLFRKFSLDNLCKGNLATRMAEATCSKFVVQPFARSKGVAPSPDDLTELRTPRDLELWITETLIYCAQNDADGEGSRKDAHLDPAFWINAAEKPQIVQSQQ